MSSAVCLVPFLPAEKESVELVLDCCLQFIFFFPLESFSALKLRHKFSFHEVFIRECGSRSVCCFLVDGYCFCAIIRLQCQRHASPDDCPYVAVSVLACRGRSSDESLTSAARFHEGFMTRMDLSQRNVLFGQVQFVYGHLR
ncbi:hypothetical protein TcCL_Unassigned00509 [Trypanosoma cruzi]|nr:hypothetical protein TcCL_Unassigned00509 [Trypanosoma cruzi]